MRITTGIGAILVFVTCVSSEHYSHPHPHPHQHPHSHSHSHSHPHPHPHSLTHPLSHADANRNQRIIKVQGPSHLNHHHHHHGHHKHIRNGPLGPHIHYSDKDHDQHYEYVRPNHPPPIPPFFNGHSSHSSHNNHVKHLPRPPPSLAHHKSPSFGNGFPHKTSSHSFRPPVIKDHFRAPTGPHRPQSQDFFPSPVSGIHSSDNNRGPIHEIPAPNLGPKPSGSLYKSPDFIHGKGPSIEIPKVVKETPSPVEHGPSYEVTENNHSTNDHVLENNDGTKAIYAPDPDPSLPVHKVPPTKDPYSIPSHGQKVLEEYPHLSQDFQILDGGSISAPIASLSPQELFSLMHGHSSHALQQTLPQQPVFALLGQPQQPSNLILPPEAGNAHYHQQTTNDIERYLQQSHQSGNDVSQFLQHPEIHNTLHASHQQGIVHMAMIDHINAQHAQQAQQAQHDQQAQHPVYSQNNQYQLQVPTFNNNLQYQSFNYDEKDPSAGAIPMESHQAPQVSDNYHYEPEASETRNSMAVIQQQADNNDSIKKILLNDLANNIVDNQIEDSDVRQPQQQGFEINRPDVPFYTTLPNRQAAETLATLQAAGSIASQLQNFRNQENEEEEKEEEKTNGPLGLAEEQLSKPQKINYFEESEVQTETPNTERSNDEEKNVEVQKSIPVYEASYISSSLSDHQKQEEKSSYAGEESKEEKGSDHADFNQDNGSEKFGRRIRPK